PSCASARDWTQWLPTPYVDGRNVQQQHDAGPLCVASLAHRASPGGGCGAKPSAGAAGGAAPRGPRPYRQVDRTPGTAEALDEGSLESLGCGSRGDGRRTRSNSRCPAPEPRRFYPPQVRANHMSANVDLD